MYVICRGALYVSGVNDQATAFSKLMVMNCLSMKDQSFLDGDALIYYPSFLAIESLRRMCHTYRSMGNVWVLVVELCGVL